MKKKKTTDKRAEYLAKYRREKYEQISFKLKKNDKIVEWLNQQSSKKHYIISLIIEDMKEKAEDV